MAINIEDKFSPGWWLNRLTKILIDKRDRLNILDQYYKNERLPPSMGNSKSLREAYQRLVKMSRMNYSELIVEAVRERMNVSGFRTGAADDELGDREAWSIWQANSLDANSILVHRTMLAMSESYVMIGQPAEGTDLPIITPEDPREIAIICDPINRSRIVAALKLFHDWNIGVDIAYLYLLVPGESSHLVRFVSDTSRVPDGTNCQSPLWSFAPVNWDMVDVVPTGVAPVPIVQFVNNADMFGKGTGEFETHVPGIDRINYMILTRLEVATLQAFKQRAIKGVPDTDESGDPIDYSNIFESSPSSMWLLPEGADIWESGAVDLTPIRSAVKDDVQDLAAATRTPLFYLTPEAANGSAEGAALAREGLVFKTTDRISQTSNPWKHVMSIAFLYKNDIERSRIEDMEVLWTSPERFTLSERYDAATKAQAAGVPWETVMSEVLQFSPTKIEQMSAQRASEALLAASLATPVGVTAAPAPAREMGADVKAQADAMGVLIRSGVQAEDAATRVGLAGLTFTGAVPVSLRLPETEAANLEET